MPEEKQEEKQILLCPYCQKELTACMNAMKEEEHPEAGDYTICLNCTAILIFDGHKIPRKPTQNEYSLAGRIPGMRQVIQNIRKSWAEEGSVPDGFQE